MLLDSQDTSAPIDTPIVTARDDQINRVIAATQLKKEWLNVYLERCSILQQVPNEFKLNDNIVHHFWTLTREDIETHGLPKLAALCKVADEEDLKLDDVLAMNERATFDDAVSDMMCDLESAIQTLPSPLDTIFNSLSYDTLELALEDSNTSPIKLTWLDADKRQTVYLARGGIA